MRAISHFAMTRHFSLRALVLCVLAWLLLAPNLVQAHDTHFTGAKVIWQKDALLVSITTPASDLKADDSDAANAAIRRRLKLRLDGRDYTPDQSAVMFDQTNDLVIWQTRIAQPADGIEFASRLYPEDPNSRMVVAVVREGQMVKETILDAAHPALKVERREPTDSPLNVVARFGREGIAHIFSGIDHICFIIGLLLLGGSLRSLLKAVTAFTLAHSITLTLAATGIFVLSPRIVEPIIALSIVAVAAENLRARRDQSGAAKTDWRALFAFAFGLIHGFGFAGALSEIGLPREALGWALASFNGGVEVGQAAIVLVVAPALAWLAKRKPRVHRAVVLCSSSGIAAAGAFWFAQRAFGL